MRYRWKRFGCRLDGNGYGYGFGFGVNWIWFGSD
jgi:hypothetical protein